MSVAASKPLQILMVEDNPGDVRLAREFLSDTRMENELNVVTDGAEALAFLRHRGRYANAPRPDLILLDLNLPRKSGREVLAEIKSDAQLKSIPVLVLTTSRAEQDVRASYDLHANCYITKPADLEHFISVVKAIEEFWLRTARLPSCADG